MTPEDQAAFEAALKSIPQYDITEGDLQNLFEAALAHRDAQTESLQDSLDETNAECIRIHKVNQQMLDALKAAKQVVMYVAPREYVQNDLIKIDAAIAEAEKLNQS